MSRRQYSGGKSLDQKIPWRDEYGGPYAVELSLLTRPMTTGEKRRFWIPVELAYKGKRGAPAGMLVFDVELLEIKD